jgi:hypothetical protein
MDEGAALVEQLYRADIRPEFADVIGDAVNGIRVAVRVPEAAAASAQAILGPSAQLVDAEDYVVSRDAGYGLDAALAVCVTAAPSMLVGVAERMTDLEPTIVVVRPIASIVQAAWAGDTLPEIERLRVSIDAARRALGGGKGSLTVNRIPTDWRSSVETWGEPAASLDIMRRLKDAYDPDGRLNHGRFAGGI